MNYLQTANGSKVTVVNITNGFKNIPNTIILPQIMHNEVIEMIILLEIDKQKYKHDMIVCSRMYLYTNLEKKKI